jgi:6-phosphogluconolactonase
MNLQRVVREDGISQQFMNNLCICNTPEEVAQVAADYLYQQIKNCVLEKGICHVVLPGGTTPAHCISLLAEKKLPWDNIHWYPGDERCYPIGHIDRNDTMIKSRLFTQDESVKDNFHAIPAELGPAHGAEHYALLIESIAEFDIVVLGMGEDGHTASLFPGNAALNNMAAAVPVYDSPKSPDERVSIGLDMLKYAGECIVIATGSSKNNALEKLRAGEVLPVGMVGPDVWFVDDAAVNDLSKSSAV